MNFYNIHYFCVHFLECKKFYHDRIQNYLSKIIGKECDLSKWDHTEDDPAKTVTTFHMTVILGPRGKGNQSQQTSQKTTNFFAICCLQL